MLRLLRRRGPRFGGDDSIGQPSANKKAGVAAGFSLIISQSEN
jgi:hypothetical protein